MDGNGSERFSDKEQFWRRMIRSHADGDATVRELCAAHGVSIQSYYKWKRKLTKSASVEPSLSFAEVRVVPVGAAAIEMQLAGGRLLRIAPGFDEGTLLRLVALLESDRC